jgi:UTP-glucose-1-phosphate uridylyltransferase
MPLPFHPFQVDRHRNNRRNYNGLGDSIYKLLAYRFNGTRYDCGSKLGYIKAQVAFGLKHEDLREEFAAYLATLK